jgi:hypothetical protein
MMKNKNYSTKRHRGSSPPFQGVDQGLHEWVTGSRSAYQHSDESPYVSLLDQQTGQEEERDAQESRKSGRNDQDSLNEAEFPRNQDDEYRWQDDGGESGELP